MELKYNKKGEFVMTTNNYYNCATCDAAVSSAKSYAYATDTCVTFSAPLAPTTCLKIADVEKDNKRTIAFNVAGIKIKGDKIFENKTKKTSLHFYGEADVLGKKLYFNETINVNTDIYNKYDWHVSNGILYVVLFEKINKEPEFNRVEKPKKVVKEEEK
jgi:hypothetical protein